MFTLSLPGEMRMGIWSAPSEFDQPFRIEPRRPMIGWYWIGAGTLSLCMWGGVFAALAYLA